MATGDTSTGSINDALNVMVASARMVRDYDAAVPKTVDRKSLATNTGLSWIEDRVELLTAQDVNEQTILDNPQQYSDTKFSITPTYSGIMTYITDRTMARGDSKVTALLRGQAMSRAMQRKKDVDGIAQFAVFTTALAGTGQTLVSGILSAARSRIQGNTTEPSTAPINAILHPFGEKDLQDEIVAGIGTYPVPAGMSEQFYRKGFSGTIVGVNLWTDGNIAIDSTPDARGAVYSNEAIVLVEGQSMKSYTRFRPDKGAGGNEYFLYDEYAYGQRRDAWGFSILHDATVPSN